MFATLLLVPGFRASGNQDEILGIIEIIDEQIESSTSDEERAKYCCFRARNYFKLKDIDAAEQDYLEALDTSYSGWILHEYAHFLYRNGEYERAYRASYRLNEDFPQFSKSALKLKEQARIKYQEEHLVAHPPTIIMNTEPDPNRVGRLDLIRQQKTPQVFKTDLKTTSTTKKKSTKKKTKTTAKKTTKKKKRRRS